MENNPLLHGHSGMGRKSTDEFQFKKRREAINWRLLASTSIDKITKGGDLASLQNILENLTFCDIEKEDFNTLDPNYVKLFQLSQLAIEYLLYTQESLISMRNSNNTSGKESSKQLDEWKEKCLKVETELQSVQKENRQLKKTVYAFQLWSKVPGSSAQPGPVLTHSYSRCRYCGKVFSADFYLDGHLERRHGDKPNYIKEVENANPHQYMNMPVPNQGIDAEILDKITNTIERFSSRVLDTERTLRLDLERKMSEAMEKKESTLGELFKQDRLGYEREVQELKTMMTRQLEEERRLLREERMAFDEMNKNQMRRANIGTLQDDEDEDDEKRKETELLKKLGQKYDDAFSRLTETLERELKGLKPVSGDSNGLKAENERLARLEAEKNSLGQELSETNQKLKHLEGLLMNFGNNNAQNTDEYPRSKSAEPNLDNWPKYEQIMSGFKNIPFPKNRNIKSKYSHHGVLLSGKRKEVEVLHEAQNQKRGITKDNLPEHAEKIAKLIQQERKEIAGSNPYIPKMRNYLSQELDKIVKQEFHLKPLQPTTNQNSTLNKQTGFLPHRADFFGAQKDNFLNDSMNNSGGRGTSLSRRSVRSDVSSVKWDDDDESSISSSDNDSSVDEDVNAKSVDTSRVSSPIENTTTKKFDPKKAFGKAFNVFKSIKPAEKIERRESLDPILKTAVGRVHNSGRKDPLERRKESIDEYPMSDISESLESLAKPGPEPNVKAVGSLDDLELSDDLETERLSP